MDNTEAIINDPAWILACGFLLSLISGWVAFRLGFFRFPFSERKRIELLSIKHLIGPFAVFLGLQLLFFPAVILLFLSINRGHFLHRQELSLDTPTQGWLYVCVMILSSLAVVAYCRFVTPKSFAMIWGQGKSKGSGALKQLLWGSSTWLICYPIVLTVGQFIVIAMQYFYQLPKVEQSPVQALMITLDYPALFAAMAIGIVFIVPLVEEILFRGYLQTWLVLKLGRSRAIAASSIIFVLFHTSYSLGLGNVQFLVPLLVLSVFLGFIYERQESLWAPIGLHAFFNAISVITIVLV
ncbi:MAG: type II CAAX endopeptidase family protein [Waddliaceae bacterium]